MSQKLKITFYGAAETVTGSKLLLEYDQQHFLFDCGLFQGPQEIREKNWQEFDELKKCKALVLSHAHIDHSGNIPRFVKNGFHGPIYCTPATLDLCQLMLRDAAHLQEEDARYANLKKYSRHDPALPLYDSQDAEKALKLFQAVNFHEWKELTPGLSFRFFHAGHILGSAITQFSFQSDDQTKILTLSGDLGNGRSVIIQDPEKIIETDYLVLESTYGDRRQEREDVFDEVEKIVNQVLDRGGTLIIPAFSVGRTQEILYILNHLAIEGRTKKYPVYLDSPMANAATDIYLKFQQELKKELHGEELVSKLCCSDFHEVKSVQESMALCKSTKPKIVISAAGMLTGGRVLHHLKAKLSDEKSAVMFVGYQAAGTKGLLLKNGLKEIRIYHEKIAVKADVFSVESLSAHADCEDLNQFVSDFEQKPKKVFLNHGESNALQTLAYTLKVEHNLNIEIAKEGIQYILD